MRGHRDSKSNSCTEGTKVDAVGISGKVLCLTRGGQVDAVGISGKVLCLTRGGLTDGSNAGVKLAVRSQQRA